MGLRFRKSIKLGGGARINLSKSGVGFSMGTKGYRVTKKAGGGTRETISIPGTGISMVKEKGNKAGRKKSQSRGNTMDGENSNIQSSSLKPRRRTWLWVLGWIFIFPVPMTILLLHNKSINVVIKYGLIAIAWFIYIVIAAGAGTGTAKGAVNDEAPLLVAAEADNPIRYEEISLRSFL